MNSLIVEEKSPTSKLMEYYSSWNRLRRAVGWMLKFRELLREHRQKRNILTQSDLLTKQSQNTQQTDQKLTTGLMVDDLLKAEKSIIALSRSDASSRNWTC